MRLVLDTNVLYAAFTLEHGFCAGVFRTSVVRHDIVLSEHILGELHRHLSGTGRLSRDKIEQLILALRQSASIVTPATLPLDVCRDPDDIAVLGTAVAGKAAAIVTGDKDLLSLGTFRDVLLLSPRDFQERFLGES